jgi:hypothetical protein
LGYSDPYNKLLGDATLLLEGSGGRIGLVVLIKIDPPETAVTNAFLEMWEFSRGAGKKRGGHDSYCISFPF